MAFNSNELIFNSILSSDQNEALQKIVTTGENRQKILEEKKIIQIYHNLTTIPNLLPMPNLKLGSPRARSFYKVMLQIT